MKRLPYIPCSLTLLSWLIAGNVLSGATTREDILLAHWKLDETMGTAAKDASANEKDGILQNMDDTSWVPGKFGNALSFDGTDDFVDLPLDIPISSAKGTVSLWVKTSENFADHAMVYYGSSVTDGDGFGTQNEFHVIFRDNEKVHLFVRGTNIAIASGPKYNDGKWHQVVATSDRVNKKYSLYVDGGAWKNSITDKQPRSFALNKVHRLGKPYTNKRYYKGLIDDVRLYSEPFTEEEVVLLYGDGFSDFDRLPVITLAGENPLKVNIGTDFTDPGATATDHEDGDLGAIEGKVEGDDPIDTSRLGRWTLTYTAADSAGNTVISSREVEIVDPLSPVITIVGDNPLTLEVGAEFVDPGVTVADASGNPIENPEVQVEGEVDISKPGSHTLTYTFSDAENHAAVPVTRGVILIDTTPPVISLNGEPEITLFIGQNFTDPGSTITDNVDDDIQAIVKLQLSDAGLDAHWPLDQVDDQLITPDSTGQHPGTVSGTDASALVPGIFGKALNLDGTDDVVTANDYKGITGGGIRTMSAWIKTDKANAAILNWGENTQGKKWTFRTHSNNSIRIEVNGGGVVGTSNITDNKWHHVAAVFPTTDGQLDSTLFYIDGKLEVNSATSTRKVNSAPT
ncbi:MAG: DUF5011 domain-containing protein [Opitutae bacterium]|jgi:hypothetical protein|nr:DUF5011 domain-containing protein [Opitutae bacterium]